MDPSLRPQFRSPPGGAHGSPTLALRGSSACDGGRSSRCPPRFSHLHSPGRLAGPTPPRACLAREARSSLPGRSHSSATASPTFRSAPELVSSPSSSRPGSQTGAGAGCPSPGAPCPPAFPVSPVSVGTKGWDLPAKGGVLEPRVQPEGLSFAPVAPWCPVSGRERGEHREEALAQKPREPLGWLVCRYTDVGLGLGIWVLYS